MSKRKKNAKQFVFNQYQKIKDIALSVDTVPEEDWEYLFNCLYSELIEQMYNGLNFRKQFTLLGKDKTLKSEKTYRKLYVQMSRSKIRK